MRSRVRVDRCVAAIGALEVPVILRTVSCSQDSIRVRCRLVTRGILDCLNGAAARAEVVDTWPQIHGGWCHVIETAGVVLFVRSSLKIVRSLWHFSSYNLQISAFKRQIM